MFLLTTVLLKGVSPSRAVELGGPTTSVRNLVPEELDIVPDLNFSS